MGPFVELHFDQAGSLRILEAATSARGGVAIAGTSSWIGDGLRVQYRRVEKDPAEPRIVLSFLPFSVAGRIDQIELAIHGDGSGCELLVEGGDALGFGLIYCFGGVDFVGDGVLKTRAITPHEIRGPRASAGSPTLVPPLELCRLVIHLPEHCGGISIGLKHLRMAGQVRRVLSGIV
jgi:hypothetical protein